MSKTLAQVALRDRTRREVLHRSDHVPPLPENSTRILTLLGGDETEPDELVAVLQRDQVLVARLLRMVNSPLYGLGQPVTSVRDATVVVGFRGLRSLVLASSAARHLKRDYSVYGYSEKGLWTHSLAVAVGCRVVGRTAGFGRDAREELFVAGLLHDVGKLVLVPYVHGALERLPRAGTIAAVEREVCGIDHAEAAGLVVGKWGIGGAIRELLARHHDDEETIPEEIARPLAVLRIANGLAHEQRIGYAAAAPEMGRVRPADVERLGLGGCWADLQEEIRTGNDAAVAELEGM